MIRRKCLRLISPFTVLCLLTMPTESPYLLQHSGWRYRIRRRNTAYSRQGWGVEVLGTFKRRQCWLQMTHGHESTKKENQMVCVSDYRIFSTLLTYSSLSESIFNHFHSFLVVFNYFRLYLRVGFRFRARQPIFDRFDHLQLQTFPPPVRSQPFLLVIALF